MSQFTRLGQPVTQIIRVRFDFPANSPVGTEDIGAITTDPALSATETLTVPSTEVWHITDIYAESAGDIGVDGYLDVIVNDLRQNLRFGPMAQTLKTLLNPIKLKQAVVVDRLSRLQFVFKIRSAVGASAASTTLTVELVRIPVG